MIYMSPEELLDTVNDRESFVAFVRSLADERDRAEQEEKEKPNVYVVDGAYNWKNGDIASFLWACLEYFEDRPFHKPDSEPNWRMFANFLWCGKIYE